MAINLEAMKSVNGTWETYKFLKDKKCVIPEGEVWWFDLIRVAQPKVTQRQVNGKMLNMTKHTLQLRPRDKTIAEPERIWVEVSANSYKFVTEVLKAKPLDVIGFQKTKIKTPMGGYTDSLKMFKAKDANGKVDSNTAGAIGAKSNTQYKKEPIQDIEVSDIDLEDLV
jgi:hypothetical protein